MKNKSNPLIKEDNKKSKCISRFLAVILYTFFILGFLSNCVTYVLDYHTMTGEDTGIIITGIITISIVSVVLFKRVLNRKARRSMQVMKNACSYKEMYNLLEGEKFNKVENVGFDTIEESEHWLNIAGTFVPKNFIVCGYDIDKMNGSILLCFIAINGNSCCYNVGVKKAELEKALRILQEILPHANFTDRWYFNRSSSMLEKELKIKFEKYLVEGNSIEDLIYNFTDFSEGIEHLDF